LETEARRWFEDDKDRHGWLDLLERACGRFGWRVHAWVLMGKREGKRVFIALNTPVEINPGEKLVVQVG
jgi:hypothetical protein